MAGVDVGKFAELIKALLSSQNQERQQAETLYQQAKMAEPDNLLIGFLAVLATEGLEENIRRQAAVLIRQLVTRGAEKDFVFARITPQNKQNVAAELLNRFQGEPNSKLQRTIGDVVAKLAAGAFDESKQEGWIIPGQAGWPALLPLIFQMADCTANANVASCESSLRLLKDLIPSMTSSIVQAQQQIGIILQNGLGHADPKMKVAAFIMVCVMIQELEKKDWAPLIATGGALMQILQLLLQSNLQDELQECLQDYAEVASIEPDFFKQQLSTDMQPATFLAAIVKTKQGVEEGSRNLALEWLVTFVERKPKWVAKSLPALTPLVLECCMDLMLEVEDGEAAMNEWVGRMDDEEGEDDADGLFQAGEEAVDRLVEAMTIEHCSAGLFALIGRFTSQDAWQAKHAALSAIRQTVEYVEDTAHVNEMAKLLVAHVDSPHPRVRYMALHALSQLANDHAPEFQDAWHQALIPVLVRKADDPVDRCAAMAMTAFVNFAEELDKTLLKGYAPELIQKWVQKLQSTKHRMVQEEAITSVGVIAGVIEEDFSQYYDGVMPLLKQLVMHATGEKESRLRGKAFECMSLLGFAVGKAKFLPDAKDAIAEMMKTQSTLEADDLQREYITEASERICRCLKADFAVFLPYLLPNLVKSLKLEEADVSNNLKPNTAGDDDNEYIAVSTGDGKVVKVSSSKFEELQEALKVLQTFTTEMEGAFFDCVPQIAEAVLPLLSTTDEVSLLCDEVRGGAFHLWAVLIKCARSGAAERGVASTLHAELLRTFLQRAIVTMQQNTDPDALKEAGAGVAECIKNVGSGVLSGQEALQLVQQLFKFMDDSFQRSSEWDKAKHKSAAGTPQELLHDDDEEDTTEEDENQCRKSLEEAVGAIMKVAPNEFMQCLPECSQRMAQWLPTKQNKSLALWLACDLLEHLREQSEQLWPVFMPGVFQALSDKDPDVRVVGAYAINLAARLDRFAEAAPQAFRGLAQIVGGPPPKKKQEKAKMAFENAVAALVTLSSLKLAYCPPEVDAWQLAVSKLPLLEDEDEAKKTHAMIADLLIAQNPGLLGPDGAFLGKVLSALAEVYEREEICEKETDVKIRGIFQSLPRDKIVSVAANFTEKQQKKIERMLTAPASAGGC